MKRYDSSRSIRVVITAEQRQWLEQNATGMKTMSSIVRDAVELAMRAEQAGNRQRP